MSDPVSFYLDGREAKLSRIRKLCEEPEEIAKRILASKHIDVRAAITEATQRAADALAADRQFERKWRITFEDGETPSIPASEAFALFVSGQRDELAYSLEEEVLAELGGEDEDSDDGDGDDDEERE